MSTDLNSQKLNVAVEQLKILNQEILDVNVTMASLDVTDKAISQLQ